MSGNLGYTKKFIILKKDYSNMAGLSPKGHGKLEVKGLKGSVAISLENAPDNDYYNVLLVARNSTYDLGKIYTDENGRGKEDLGFNLQDLESKGFSIDKINGVIIKRDSKVLVGGYVDKNDGSLERFIKQLPVHDEEVEETKVAETIFEEPVDLHEPPATKYIMEESSIVEQTIEDTIEDTIKEKPKLTVEDVILSPEVLKVDDEFRYESTDEIKIDQTLELAAGCEFEHELEEPSIVEHSPEVLKVDDEFKYESTDEIKIHQILESAAGEEFEPVFEPILELTQEPDSVAEEPLTSEQNKVEEVEVLEFETEQSRSIIQKNQTTSYVLNILRFFPYIEPFRLRLEGYNWWKIDFQEEARGFLPYFSYLIGGDQKSRRSDNFVTSKDLMAVYNHYLFGLYTVGEDVEYYVYAVPGGFYKDEHPHGGSTGFNTWFAGEDISGYWLLYIDPLTGKVIHPINPMNPTE